MHHDTEVGLRNPGVPGEVQAARTDVLRQGAHQLLAQAIESEVAECLARHRETRDEAGRQRIVRTGHLPPRSIQTGIGAVPVKAPRVRDRAGEIRFTSSILPPYLRRTKTREELRPWLYLKGISTGEFGEALTALLGHNAPGLSAGTISRLKAAWQHDHARWERRDLGRGARSTCICGSTASTSACAWKRPTRASSSSSVPRPRARKSSWRSPTDSVNPRNPGRRCGWTCSAAA